MKLPSLACLCLLALATTVRAQDDLLDRLDDALTLHAFDGDVRARLSGLVDLEGYHFHQPAPALIETTSNNLFNPRLSLFLDVQLGPHLYLFAQSRLDRGFDPSSNDAQVRMDEYALRFTPWEDGRFNVQVGKFAMVVGNWVERHQSWENPFVTAPLPYENLTSVRYDAALPSPQAFLAQKRHVDYDTLPLIWGPNYTTGAAISGKLGTFDYAAEIKNAPISADPSVWDATNQGFAHPTVSARLGWRPDEMWSLGVSGSDGPYLQSEATPTLPQGKGIGDYHEKLLGQDVRFAWHHWQLWAEVFEARFEVPHVGNADSLAYYLEAKYKFSPELYGALRWNQQFFGDVNDGNGGSETWGRDTWRVDAAIGWRFTAHTQFKLQYSLQHDPSPGRDFANELAAQFTLRF